MVPVDRCVGEDGVIESNQPVAYVNGAFVSEAEATISVFDRGLRFADTVFDTLNPLGSVVPPGATQVGTPFAVLSGVISHSLLWFELR